jgi:hypothetical protein
LDFDLVSNNASSEGARSQHAFSMNQTPQAGAAVSLLGDSISITQSLSNYSTGIQLGAFSVVERNSVLLDNFEAELASYPQSDVHFGISENWNTGSANF